MREKIETEGKINANSGKSEILMKIHLKSNVYSFFNVSFFFNILMFSASIFYVK